MIATAERKAESVVETLRPFLESGDYAVVIEPGDLAMFRGDYEKPLTPADYEAISEGSYETLEYV